MAKPLEFPIKESVQELKSLRKKQPGHRFEKRIIWLESIQTKRFRARKQLAGYLNISPRIGERWSEQYIDHGIEGLLSDEPKS